MKKSLFCILSLLVTQLTIAGQLHEIDINNCPGNLSVFHGDTVRWTNSSSLTRSVKSALFGLKYVAPNKNHEHHFAASLHPVKASYFCINDSTESVLSIERSPVAIFPKMTFLPEMNYRTARTPEWVKYFNIQLFISEDNPSHMNDKIKQLSILVDGQSVNIDSMDDLNQFREKSDDVVAASIFANGNGSFVMNGDKGYSIITFHLLKRGLSPNDKHLVQVSVTIDTGKGEATYQDEAEIFLIRGFDFFEF